MSDVELLDSIWRCCCNHTYDSAIGYTNLMQNKIIALKAHLLVLEHEQAYKNEQTK